MPLLNRIWPILLVYLFVSLRKTDVGRFGVVQDAHLEDTQHHKHGRGKVQSRGRTQTIVSGSTSSGESIAEANGCNNSGLGGKCSELREGAERRGLAPATNQFSSYNHSMDEHLEQKFRSELVIRSFGVSRSRTAL
jgi:hypothetical protein